MHCELCGKEISRASVFYQNDVKFCSSCFESEGANRLVAQRQGQAAEPASPDEVSRSSPNPGLTETPDAVQNLGALATYAQILSGLGWAMMIVTAVFVLMTLGSFKMMALGFGLYGVFMGFSLVVAGQAVQCFLAIEANTRKTALALARILEGRGELD